MSEIYITAGDLPGEGRVADDAGSYIDFDRARLADPLAKWIIAQAWATATMGSRKTSSLRSNPNSYGKLIPWAGRS